MNETTRRTILSAVTSFPAMSVTATKVLKLLNQPSTNAAAVEAAVKLDPGLTANILRMANSAYFGFPGAIRSVTHAITRLGWKRMSQLVLASTVHSLMERPVPGYDLDRGELWRRAITGAVAAEIIADKTPLCEADEAFTAALLREIGKLVIGDYIKSFTDQIEAALAAGMSPTDAEREILGTDHVEVGACILEHWSLPKTLVRAVAEYPDPDAADPPSPLADTVHVADALARRPSRGKDSNAKFDVSASALRRLNLTPADLHALAKETQAAIKKLGDAFPV